MDSGGDLVWAGGGVDGRSHFFGRILLYEKRHERLDLVRVQYASLGFCERGHQRIGFSEDDVPAPVVGAGLLVERGKIGNHLGAMLGGVADAADGIEKTFAGATHSRPGMTRAAMFAKHGLPVLLRSHLI